MSIGMRAVYGAWRLRCLGEDLVRSAGHSSLLHSVCPRPERNGRSRCRSSLRELPGPSETGRRSKMPRGVAHARVRGQSLLRRFRKAPSARSSRESRGERPDGAGRRALEWQRELPDRLIHVGCYAEKARPRPDLLAFFDCRQSGTPSAKVSSRFSKVVVRSRSRIFGTTMRSISFPKTLVGSSVSMIPTSVNSSSSTSS